jgi:alkanesulfonate monooxygenase SsuD/methylene tetrahydromethanopterin reductase-like flavin-dependent oxidoreductase (luciferase family)
MAERAGFERLWISDHFHPWNAEQGNSPFVWSVIGALSEAVSLPVTTTSPPSPRPVYQTAQHCRDGVCGGLRPRVGEANQ